MHAVKMTITRYVSDEPQPGIVECEMVDARGRQWVFLEKTAVVSRSDLDANTSYPIPTTIAVEIVGQYQDAHLGEVVRIDTDRPWGIQSVEGETKFDVLLAFIVEL